MTTTWVLHTETKGTGAQMVPLETVTKRASSPEPVFVPRQVPEPAQMPAAAPPQTARRFRVVDVMTRQPIVEDGDAREAMSALVRVRSLIDVNVYVWQEERELWRLLSLAEQRAMRDLAAAATQSARAS